MSPSPLVADCLRLCGEICALEGTLNFSDQKIFRHVYLLASTLTSIQARSSDDLEELNTPIKEISLELVRLLKFIQSSGNSTTEQIQNFLVNHTIELDRYRSWLQVSLAINTDKKVDAHAEALQKQSFESNVDSLYECDPPISSGDDDRSIIGRGAFGVTHRMKNNVDGGLYAVKVIHIRDAAVYGVEIEDMQNEVSILQQLNHPYIVRYYASFFTSKKAKFKLVMELVTGGTIALKVKDKSVSLDMIVNWWNQLASALYYMHFQVNVQHRDIKPENIMLTSWGDIKIIDFGLACIVKSKAARDSKVGTSTYFSYEKAIELPYDGRDDVWAAGCVMAELMTKSRLRERGGGIWMHTNATVNDRRIQLISDVETVDAHYGCIIGRMLEAEQINRCNAAELQNLLNESCTANNTSTKSADSRSRGFNQMSWSELQSLANIENGDANAQYIISQKYVAGVEFSRNMKRAFEYALKASDQGHLEAQYFVGKCFELGEGVNQNFSEAFKHYKMCSDQRDARAQIAVGMCYENGRGVDIDKSKAFKYYQLAAHQGNADGQYNLARCHLNNYGVVRDNNKIFEYFQKAANGGHLDAKYELWKCFSHGRGVVRNKSKAMECLLDAADCGQVHAICTLGDCYMKGSGIRKNEEEGFKCFQRAANVNDKQGLYQVGLCYYEGKSVTVDKDLAFDYFKRAADINHLESQFIVGECYDQGIGVTKNSLESFKYFKMASENGHVKSKIYLGIFYMEGTTVHKDAIFGVKLCQEAMSNKTIDYFSKFGQFYSEGIVDKKKVFDCFIADNSDTTSIEDAVSKKSQNSSSPTSEGSRSSFFTRLRTNVSSSSRIISQSIRASDDSSAESFYDMGQVFDESRTSVNDSIHAFDCYKKAADLNHTVSQYIVARRYSKAFGTVESIEESLKYLKLAAEGGHTMSQVLLGSFFMVGGDFIPQNESDGFSWFARAAESQSENIGSVLGLFCLGICYHEGKSVSVNKFKAFEYFKKAADQEFLLGQLMIAKKYRTGDGVLANFEDSFKYYMCAANRGCSSAMYHVGKCYSNGRGVSKNKEEAVRYCSMAVKNYSEESASQNEIVKFPASFFSMFIAE